MQLAEGAGGSLNFKTPVSKLYYRKKEKPGRLAAPGYLS